MALTSETGAAARLALHQVPSVARGDQAVEASIAHELAHGRHGIVGGGHDRALHHLVSVEDDELRGGGTRIEAGVEAHASSRRISRKACTRVRRASMSDSP